MSVVLTNTVQRLKLKRGRCGYSINLLVSLFHVQEKLTCRQICDKYHAIHAQIYEWFPRPPLSFFIDFFDTGFVLTSIISAVRLTLHMRKLLKLFSLTTTTTNGFLISLYVLCTIMLCLVSFRRKCNSYTVPKMTCGWPIVSSMALVLR